MPDRPIKSHCVNTFDLKQGKISEYLVSHMVGFRDKVKARSVAYQMEVDH